MIEKKSRSVIALDEFFKHKNIYKNGIDGETFRWLRQYPKVLSLPFKTSVKRAERSNAIDLYVTGDVGKDVSIESWQANFDKPVDLLTEVLCFLS